MTILQESFEDGIPSNLILSTDHAWYFRVRNSSIGIGKNNETVSQFIEDE